MKDYIVYLIALGMFILAFVLYRSTKRHYGNSDKTSEFTVSENVKGVAIDSAYFYAIGGNSVGKYSRTGKRVAHIKLPFKHLTGGKIINGDLVIIDRPKEGGAVIWLNPKDLSFIDIVPLPIPGSLTWIDWAWNKWWVCSSNDKNTLILCFNSEWTLEGDWKLPKKLLSQVDELTGGDWYEDYLYVSGDDNSAVYALTLPPESTHAVLHKKVPVCFDGNGFVFEQGTGKVYGWGTSGNQLVVKCKVHL